MTSIINRIAILAFVATGACASDPKALECKNGIFCPDGTICAAVQQVCLTTTCGNGTIEGNELCDDGNIMDGDGCSRDCQSREGCGDGVRNSAAGEICDDGNTNSGDGCAGDCRSEEQCRNGIKDVNEACDDGNTVSNDGCDTNCTFTACGNGVKTDVEACDDGNLTDNDGCDSNCKPTGCGNGVTTAPEMCDDANSVNGDGCDNNCRPTSCGNGIQTGIEVCDDGNNVSGDDCSADCLSLEVCGNNIRDLGAVPPEVCDDGDTMSGDGCSADCLSAEICGNGIRDINEVCDDGNTMGGDSCSPDCQSGLGCGNGTVDPTEECDDGNAVETDDCLGNCKRALCGDGVEAALATGVRFEQCDGAPLGGSQATESALCNIDCTDVDCGDQKVNQSAGETCDDGNATEGDGCDSNCKISACGNGIKSPTEGCDDGNLVSNDTCDANCTIPACGNGIVNPGLGEQCDDGNTTTGDGCDSNCEITGCGNGVVGPGEQCDDGNLVNGDTCDTNCTTPACGNGIRTGTEVCDDGDLVNGDGCDSNCRPTGCGNAIVTAGEQCDDGNMTNGDTCDNNCTTTACGNGITTAGEDCDDGNQINTDSCTNACDFPVCGDTFVRTTSPTEQCDDGNMVTEPCPYGATSCSVCGSSCQFVSGATSLCGDGTRNMPQETCDDGNNTCGSCNATCQAVTSAKATGTFTVGNENQLSDGETFVLNDGVRGPVTFEYNETGGVGAGNISIAISNGDNQATVRTKTRNAINNASGLDITATDGTTGQIVLTNDRFSSVGNVAIVENMSNSAFVAVGMSGGAGGDCALAQACRGALDCLSGICAGNVCVDSVTVTITSAPPDPTNDATPSITFSTASPNPPVTTQCQVDAGAFANCTSPFTTGTLAAGAHSITVRATDAMANQSTDTTGSFTIDLTAPVITVMSPPTPSNNTTPTITFSSADATSFTCQVDAGAQAPCTSPYVTPALAEGAHTVTVRGADAATNIGTGIANFTIDLTPPVVTVTPVANPTNDSTPSVAFTAPGATTQCSVDGGAFANCTTGFTPPALSDGPHAISVRATDPAGNQSTGSTSFTVDTAVPTVMITTPPSNPTNNNRPDIAFIIMAGPATTTCAIDGGAQLPCVSPFTPASPGLSNAAHTIVVTATDAAGNVGTATTGSFTVDTVAPTLTVTPVPNPTNDATPPVTFVAGGATSTTCSIDGGAFTTCTSPFSPGTNLTQAQHTITVRATDAANNSVDGSTTFVVDTTAPVINISMSVPAATNDNTPTVTFSVSGSPATVTCQVDAGAATPCLSSFTTGTLTDAAHSITIVATDAAGNADTEVINFTVDTGVPTVAFTDGPDNGAPTGDPTPTFTFSATGASTTTCSVDGGLPSACAGAGFTTATLTANVVHTVVVTASDAAGNTATDTATFLVNPTVACLDGMADRGDATITSVVNNASQATVEFWFRGNTPMAPTTDYALVDIDVPANYPEAANDPSVTITYDNGALEDSLVVRVETPTMVNTRTFALGVGHNIDDWHHYAVVFGANITLFVDGIAVTGTGTGTEGFDNAFGAVTSPIALHVGANHDTASTGFTDGALLDLRISSTARYAAPFTPVYPFDVSAGTLLLYPLDEATGTQSFDLLNPSLRPITWVSPTWSSCF